MANARWLSVLRRVSNWRRSFELSDRIQPIISAAYKSLILIYIAFQIGWAFWWDLRLVWYLRGLSWCTRGDAILNAANAHDGCRPDGRATTGSVERSSAAPLR